MLKPLIATGIVAILATSIGSAQEKRMTDNPGPEHASLMKLSGEYTSVSKFKLSPNDAGQESKGTSKFTPILDGRFILEDGTGEQFNQPFKARKLYGYNNASKRFESCWIYTGSTAMMMLSGTSSDGGKTVQFTGGIESANNTKANFEVLLKRLDENRFVVELIMKSPDGTKGPSMETTYTRK